MDTTQTQQEDTVNPEDETVDESQTKDPDEPDGEIQKFLLLTGLHTLYRHTHKPLELYSDTISFLEKGAPVNYVDDVGLTALSLLVLHINRGLRYHIYRPAELAKLEDENALWVDLAKASVTIDAAYKEQVYKCLVELLRKGADCNLVPGTCPAIPFEMEWSEVYEHKIMQSDQRWNLFALGGNMEYTTYSIFNPMTTHRPLNSKNVTVLHLAAWRGDAQCLRLLLEHGADVHASTTDGRNALHFLYLYCNKPDDLPECTQILTQQGIDVNAVDTKGLTPLFLLLNHFLVKKSHVKYLANSYTEANIAPAVWNRDHYRVEIKQCVEFLLEAGAKINHEAGAHGNALHYIYERFERSLLNCEPEFQVRGHHLVPYHFRVTPLIEFSQLLLQLGCEVNCRGPQGKTPLLHLVAALRNLSLDQNLNSSAAVSQCFNILLAGGATVNAEDTMGKTALHHIVENACTSRNSLERHLAILKLLVSHGGDVCSQDNKGNSLLHLVLGSNLRAEHMQGLLTFLLQCGADPNIANSDHKHPLNSLLRQHIHHHDPLSLGGVALRLDRYLRTVDIICAAMSLETLGYVFSVYRESGFWGVICEEACRVHQLLKGHCTGVRTLKHGCRLTIWRHLQGLNFLARCHELPLPREIVAYICDVGT